MQQPKRFQAPTMAEAYDQVRRELGDQAVILSTRKAFAPGLFGQPGRQFVEVVARVPGESPETRSQRPTLDQDQAAHDMVRAIAEAAASAPIAQDGPFAGFQAAAAAADLPAAARGGRKRATAKAPAAIPAAASIDEMALPMPAAAAMASMPSMASMGAARNAPTGAPTGAPMGGIGRDAGGSEEPWSRQLDQMRSMLEQLVSDRLDQRIEGGPAGLRDMKERLVRHGMTSALAASVLNDVDAAAARDEQALAAGVERRLAAKLPPTVALNPRRHRAVFLVGPGGAGKTTMAIRMALDLQQQGLNVVVAGTDVNRAGAPQQLTAFGAVTGLDVRLCYAPGELEEILAEPGVDLVIIDTPGHNGLRRDRMAELSSFLQAARQRMVLLTVPATMKGADLAEVVSAYSAVGLDGAVVTRCDETTHFGHVAPVLVEAALGMAFATRSDQVSDAPAPADNLALAEAIVRAQWPQALPAAAATRRAPAGRTLAKVG
ncbi:MAG: hypothetical protein AB7F65_08935 [Dehalococcoidia bacterium]